MARVKRGVQVRARHKKIIKMAKGYRGRSNNCYRIAIQKVEKGLRYAYRDRRNRKRTFRRLWIQRINAAARLEGLTYGRLINGLKLAGVTLNRKMLSEIAIASPEGFKAIAAKASDALKNKQPAAKKQAKKAA
jgi:large subunit ribosomal protein L20